MKTAIIIGATSGLGRGVAESLLEEGWKVGIAGRRIEALKEIQEKYGAENVAIARMDVTEETCTEALDSLISALSSMNGSNVPDLLLYASGCGSQNRALAEDIQMRLIETNCTGMVRIVDHFVNFVRKNPAYNKKHRAHIAVITSVAGIKPLGASPAYSATKKMQSAYISSLVQLSHMENIPINFTDIRPGFVRTDILDPNRNYPMVLSKEEGVRLIVKALNKRKRVFVFDWRFRAIVFISSLIPNRIWERFTFLSR